MALPGVRPLLSLALALLLAACAAGPAQEQTGTAEPDPNRFDSAVISVLPPYLVKSTDSFDRLVERFGLDAEAFAALNELKKPYSLKPGQILSLNVPGLSNEQKGRIMSLLVKRGGGPVKAAPAEPAVAVEDEAVVVEEPEAEVEQAPVPEEEAIVGLDVDGRGADDGTWQWPVVGPVIEAYDELTNKGIDIAGERGDSIVSAADGVVQQVFDDVPAYGRLLVIQHGDRYLGFYGHNEEILVKVGERVTAGQAVSTLGDSGAAELKLHFEIRRDAQTVDPLELLPPR